MLEIQNLTKTFVDDHGGDGGGRRRKGRVLAIDDLSVTVEEGQFFTLLGPSGCGKTTTLRSIAGLEEADTGRITLAGRDLFRRDGGKDLNVPANRRGLGMVFQSYAIWPHMSVFDNAAFPLQVGRGDRPDRRTTKDRVMRVLEIMELESLAHRPATKLSGGQQQRLALARAIVTEPPLLLLDEPLSNLDAKLRESLRFEIKRLQHELGITTVYVTHDQTEALAMSTRIAVMDAGRIVQCGPPREIYQTPNSTFVAEFIGASNLIPGTVQRIEDGMVEVATGMGRIVACGSGQVRGAEVLLSVRPEVLTLDAAGPNTIPGHVVASSFLGDCLMTVVRTAEADVRVRSRPEEQPATDAEVKLSVRPEDVYVIDTDK